jgi:threonine dehydrogenase-like Zn-dependent dehydrogenase
MKKLKVGIFGFGPRGQSFIKSLMLLNCDIVAVCENRPAQLDEVKKLIGKKLSATLLSTILLKKI